MVSFRNVYMSRTKTTQTLAKETQASNTECEKEYKKVLGLKLSRRVKTSLSALKAVNLPGWWMDC